MTLRLSRKPGARSPKQNRANEKTDPVEHVQLTEDVPPPTPSPEPHDPACQISAGHGATVATEVTHDAAFADKANSSYTSWLTRDKAASYLRSAGYPISEQQLAKLAVSGDCPQYRRWGRRVLDDPTLLMKWARDRESTPGRPAHHPMT
jgi:hypothetical protein